MADVGPGKRCLGGLKLGWRDSGVTKFYSYDDDWASAQGMGDTWDKENVAHGVLSPKYHMEKLNHKSIAAAPDFSYIVYGGGENGHIEQKVPVWFFKLHYPNVKKVWAKKDLKEVQIDIDRLDYVYISDYVDAFPRSDYNSRIANGTKDNGRWVKSIYVLRER